ncbi:flagellar export chaperone FlgN [uncultured Oscillibacter sp.]|uniref:flagellar export chaperone FlgN n=1 Tax=uncultured Oscillibacter sp. TaxID=876091 RepID=UPI00261F7C8F|nr:flagellar export chaperone FlgN [uncultured Oscillibacter sp.]
MSDVYQAYLALLRSLGKNLEQLSALAQKKAAAANSDDLMALDEIMKQEQAMTLAFRGMEQTREKLLSQLGCGDLPLSRMPEHFPPEAQGQAREAVALLQKQYQDYRKEADGARTVLERHLREIDAIITSMGGASAPEGGPGYVPPPPPDTPPSMKTDFRA